MQMLLDANKVQRTPGSVAGQSLVLMASPEAKAVFLEVQMV